jgi:hypothetical protein
LPESHKVANCLTCHAAHPAHPAPAPADAALPEKRVDELASEVERLREELKKQRPRPR